MENEITTLPQMLLKLVLFGKLSDTHFATKWVALVLSLCLREVEHVLPGVHVHSVVKFLVVIDSLAQHSVV